MTTPYGPASLIDEIHGWLKGRTELDRLQLTDLDLTANLRPPSIVVGPPTMTAETSASGGGGPVAYRLTVYVVVVESARAFRDMLDLTQLVVRALDEPAGIRVTEWRPTTFPAGATELPAYAIDIEVTA